VAHRLVTDQGGRLTLSSDERSGTRFTVTLPAAGTRQSTEQARSLPASTPPCDTPVLVGEDHAHIAGLVTAAPGGRVPSVPAHRQHPDQHPGGKRQHQQPAGEDAPLPRRPVHP
jgi:hypothetical protein